MDVTVETEQGQNSDKKFVHLVADNKLILHTEVARILFYGEWKYGRIGLIKFARLMVELWKAYRADDPYAEQTLIKIYKALADTKLKMKQYEELLHQQLSGIRGFVVDLFHRPEPFFYPVQFATPLSFLAAMLLEQVDYVNRQLYTITRLGLVPYQDLRPGYLMRNVQDIFRLSFEWQYTGVTRKDILEESQKAEQASILFGAVSIEILNKTLSFHEELYNGAER